MQKKVFEWQQVVMSAAVLGLAACGGSTTAVGGDGGVDGEVPDTSISTKDSGHPVDSSKADSHTATKDTGTTTKDQSSPSMDATGPEAGTSDAETPDGSGTGTGSDGGISSSGSGSGSSSGSNSSGASSGSSSGSGSGSASSSSSAAKTCTKDSQCNANQICDTATSSCVSSVCTAAEQSSACANPADVCCSLTCAPGDCCTSTDCTTAAAPVCNANVCGKCTQDADCTKNPAFGAAFICNTTSGACVSDACTMADTACTANPGDFCCNSKCQPGDCCTSADCKTGKLLTCIASTCAACTLDSQCPAGDVCDLTTGGCVTNTGATDCTANSLPGANGGKPGTCNVNTNDMCCTAAQGCIASAGANACCPGSAGDTYCQTTTKVNTSVCDKIGDVCTTCAAETGNVWYVDPVNGSDSGGTGNNTVTPACALQTIARAITLIGATAAPQKIIIVGAAGGVSLAAAETYPIKVPAFVTITTTKGPVNVEVPNGAVGFILNQANSGITGAAGAALTITTKGTGETGIEVEDGSAVATTSIGLLTVTGMAADGIVVTGGGVTVEPGVESLSNGAAGLHVTGVGAATVSAAQAADAAIQFNSNKGHGILVDTAGAVTVNGVVTGASTGAGTVQANKNTIAGLYIEQTPVNGGKAPANAVTGLVSFGTTGGNGLRFFGGSNVTLRNSASLGNSGSGVVISTYVQGAVTSNSLANIDLGVGAEGGNTFQALLNMGNNGGVGICLDVAANTGKLTATGNTFRGINCSTVMGAAGQLVEDQTGCASSVAICGGGGVCDLGFESAALAVGNSFVVTGCTP